MARLRLALCCAGLVGWACTFHVDPNQGLFSCSSDSDCGGGYQCIPQLNRAQGLCFPIGQCDAGTCCDVAHDGGDLFTDDTNCGACGHACAAGTGCDGGVCRETDCADGIDNDGNGLTDCADPNCPGRPCSTTDAGFVCGLAWVPVDAGVDGGADAGMSDAGMDAGAPDGGTSDGGSADAGSDAGTPDAGPLDAGTDAGTLDAGADAGMLDAGYVQVPACVPSGG